MSQNELETKIEAEMTGDSSISAPQDPGHQPRQEYATSRAAKGVLQQTEAGDDFARKLTRDSTRKRARPTASSAEESDTHSEDDAKGTETKKELEQKRLSSRLSSKRSQERKKVRVDYLRAQEERLQSQNVLVRAENEKLVDAINVLKGALSHPAQPRTSASSSEANQSTSPQTQALTNPNPSSSLQSSHPDPLATLQRNLTRPGQTGISQEAKAHQTAGTTRPPLAHPISQGNLFDWLLQQQQQQVVSSPLLNGILGTRRSSATQQNLLLQQQQQQQLLLAALQPHQGTQQNYLNEVSLAVQLLGSSVQQAQQRQQQSNLLELLLISQALGPNSSVVAPLNQAAVQVSNHASSESTNFHQNGGSSTADDDRVSKK